MIRAKYNDLTPDNELIKKAKFWGDESDDILTYEDIDDAIGDVLADIPTDERPRTIEVYAFRPMEVKVNPEDILSPILESLDEDFGNPHGDYSEPTTKMLEAAKLLARVIDAEYDSWACESFGVVEVDVGAWILEHWTEN
jgi:hypothetical protein